jgi:4-aminobutyrate aminotransferase-like enzyme
MKATRLTSWPLSFQDVLSPPVSLLKAFSNLHPEGASDDDAGSAHRPTLHRRADGHHAPPPEAVFTRGHGSWLWDSQGRRYLDLVQGWAVNTLGHAPPQISAALAAQSQRLLQPGPGLFNDRARRNWLRAWRR